MLRIIDGATLWNPYEGLAVAANLMKVMYDWVQSGRAAPPNGIRRGDACAALKSLERTSRAIRPLVRDAASEWYKAKKTRAAPLTITIEQSRGQALANLLAQLTLFKKQFADSKGSMRLADLAISYPERGVEIRFTTDSYFDFAIRSVTEVVQLARTGILSGPAQGQIF